MIKNINFIRLYQILLQHAVELHVYGESEQYFWALFSLGIEFKKPFVSSTLHSNGKWFCIWIQHLLKCLLSCLRIFSGICFAYPTVFFSLFVSDYSCLLFSCFIALYMKMFCYSNVLLTCFKWCLPLAFLFLTISHL